MNSVSKSTNQILDEYIQLYLEGVSPCQELRALVYNSISFRRYLMRVRLDSFKVELNDIGYHYRQEVANMMLNHRRSMPKEKKDDTTGKH